MSRSPTRSSRATSRDVPPKPAQTHLDERLAGGSLGDERKRSVLVFGAGAVGCFIGGAWQAAGLDVSFLGREAIRDEVAAHGLTLTDHAGFRTHLTNVDFATRPAALKKADVILFCVKGPATAAAAREIGRHAAKSATILTFQNGPDSADRLQALLPRHEVIPAMIPYNVVRAAPGHWHRATFGDLVAQRTPLTERLSTAIGNRAGRLTLSDDMTGVAWGKLLLNLNNAINALSGRTLLDELKQRDYRRVLAAAIVETLGILDAAGIVPAKIGEIAPKLLPHAIGAPDLVFNNLFLRLQKIDPAARSSMADDFAAGRPTEIDDLNGAVIRLAAKVGRAAPVNAAIVDLVRQAEAGVEHVWSPEQLRKYVLEGHRGVAIFGY